MGLNMMPEGPENEKNMPDLSENDAERAPTLPKWYPK